MKPTEFIKKAIDQGIPTKTAELNDYVISVVGLPTFNRLNDLSDQTDLSSSEMEEVIELLATIPSEIAFYYTALFVS